MLICNLRRRRQHCHLQSMRSIIPWQQQVSISCYHCVCAHLGEKRGQEVFSGVIICRFLYSLFPLCLAHIRCANSTPPAIPGVQEKKKVGRALREWLWEHMGRAVDKTADNNVSLQAQSQIQCPTSFVVVVFINEGVFEVLTSCLAYSFWLV